jgi:RES domain-containing protein
MSLRVYRVCRKIHARLDGAGAKQAGGRWNSPGRAVVYMAESVSLAVLENLVHLSPEDFPVGYVSIAAPIPDSVSILTEADLRNSLKKTEPHELGDHWIDSLASAVLKVRSAVVPAEHIYLLNPLHGDFAKITIVETVPFVFDERLVR